MGLLIGAWIFKFKFPIFAGNYLTYFKMIIYNVKNFLESRTSTLRISGRANYLVTFLVCMIQLNLQRTTHQICGRAEISDFSKRVCVRRLGGGGRVCVGKGGDREGKCLLFVSARVQSGILPLIWSHVVSIGLLEYICLFARGC